MLQFLAALLAACTAWAAEPDAAAVLENTHAPEQFDADLERLTGEVVVVHFWASWCIPCRDEMETLAEFRRTGYPALADRGLRVLTVSNDVRDQDLQRFAARVPLTFPLYYDPYSRLTGRFGVRGLPSTLVLDQHGEVLEQWLGPQEWTSQRFRARLDRLLEAGANDAEASRELDLTVRPERR